MSKSKIEQCRSIAYAYLFGESCTVNATLAPDPFGIDVCVYPPRITGNETERNFYTLATWGMSNDPMPGASVTAGCASRAELILYCDQAAYAYCDLLRWLAKLPFQKPELCYGFGTTMTNGIPAKPIFCDSELTSFLFLIPPIMSDASLGEMLTVEGDEVTFLWVVPITESERIFIRSTSVDRFLEILDQRQHPLLLSEQRRSYI